MENLNFLGKLEMGLQLERLVIGIEEPILVKDLGEIMAKIDSGNGGYNVIHGEDITYQGNQVLFLTYDGAGNPRRMSKKLKEELEVHIGGGIIQKRPVIELDIKFANEDYKKIPFSVTDRTENTHRILISKEFVEKTIEALIDVGAKNISNLNYDVDYEPVHEANDFDGNIVNDKANTENPKKDNFIKRAYNNTKKAYNKTNSFLDKAADFAEKFAPHGQLFSSDGDDNKKKNEEVVNAWKTPAKIFANYKEFYKKDQELIKSKIITNDAIRQELEKGDQSNILVKDGKILANRLKGISVFSYLLKKGDAGPVGKNGSPIKGQEQRRELWFKFNNDSKKALKAMQKQDEKDAAKNASDKDDEQTQENQTVGESLEKIFNKASKLILEMNDAGVTSKSFDVTNMGRATGGSSSSVSSSSSSSSSEEKKENENRTSQKKTESSNNEEISDEAVEEIKSESERIFGLKGFILYYVSLSNKNNKEALQNLNERILGGAFDDGMSSFIVAGQGDNANSIEKVTSAIKQYVTSNQKLVSELPGVFALCYSENLAVENSPRNIIFITKSTITSSPQNEQEGASGAQEEMDYAASLKEKLNLPSDDLSENDRENLISLLKSEETNQENQNQEIDLESLKSKLNLPNDIESNEETLNALKTLLDGNKPDDASSEINIDTLKSKLGLPNNIKENDLIDVLNGSSEITEDNIEVNDLKTKLDMPDDFDINDDVITKTMEMLDNTLTSGKTTNVKDVIEKSSVQNEIEKKNKAQTPKITNP